MHLAVCDLNQHRLIILCRMVGEGSRGRKRRLPGTIEPCKERRHCGADRCDEQLVGTSISQHYKSKTDFGKLKELRSLPRQLAEEKLKTLDPHCCMKTVCSMLYGGLLPNIYFKDVQ